jgi:type II secretory pathway pseudopilin PulG
MNVRRRHEQGQSIILVAAAMVALVLFVGLAVDVSKAYVDRRTAQNAADAAALAGARQLAHMMNTYQLDTTQYTAALIKADMNDFGERNGVQDTNDLLADEVNDNIEGFYLNEEEALLGPIIPGQQVDPDAMGIEAIAHIEAPTFFGGIIGLDGLPLTARATVILEPACTGECVVPIATYVQDFDDPTVDCWNFWDNTQNDQQQFGWLNWTWNLEDQCSNSENCLQANLNEDDCTSGWIEVGDWVANDGGISASKDIKNILNCYGGFDLEPGGTETCDHPGVPQPFTVIIYDVHGCPWDDPYCEDGWECTCAKSGSGSPDEPTGHGYRVAGFARFQLIGYKLANEKEGQGHDGNGCEGQDPGTGGNRITGRYLGTVEGGSGNCGASGAMLAPRLRE